MGQIKNIKLHIVTDIKTTRQLEKDTNNQNGSKIRSHRHHHRVLKSRRRRSRRYVITRPENRTPGSITQKSGRRHCQSHIRLEGTQNHSPTDHSKSSSENRCGPLSRLADHQSAEGTTTRPEKGETRCPRW